MVWTGIKAVYVLAFRAIGTVCFWLFWYAVLYTILKKLFA